MNINNALLDVYKKELAKYKKEHFIYKMRLGKYEDLNIPPTEEEINNEMIENTFKEAYEEEQNNKNGDIERVNRRKTTRALTLKYASPQKRKNMTARAIMRGCRKDANEIAEAAERIFKSSMLFSKLFE